MRHAKIIIFALLLCHCRTAGTASDVKLVGGQVAAADEFPATFIWTTESATLTQSYCTGSKVAPSWILTAAHCVLSQSPLPGETYIGPWRKTGDYTAGNQLRLSFSRTLDADHREELVTVMELVLPPTVESCVANPDRDRRLCQYREPIPDVALIRISPRPGSVFASTTPANIDTSEIGPGEKIFMMGYGSEEESYRGPPRLKYAAATVSTQTELEAALQNTYASDDGLPDWNFFFGVASPLDDPKHKNLGFGDSGGPVYRQSTGAIVGVNSDGFCPIGNRNCSSTTNSTFAKLDDRGSHGVGRWLRSVLRER